MRIGNGAGTVRRTGKDTARKQLVGRDGRMGLIMRVAAAWSGPFGLAGVTVASGWSGGDTRNTRGRGRSRRWRCSTWRGLSRSVILGGANNGEEEQRKGEGGFVHHSMEEWYSVKIRVSVNDHFKIFPAPFYIFLLALCSARCTIEKRDAVGRIRVRRLRWRIEELARLLSPTSISVEQTNNQSEDTKMQLPALSTFLVMQTMTQIEIKLSEAWSSRNKWFFRNLTKDCLESLNYYCQRSWKYYDIRSSLRRCVTTCVLVPISVRSVESGPSGISDNPLYTWGNWQLE